MHYRQRVLRQYDCTPVSYPPMPSTHLHPLWQVWDTAVDDLFCQLPLQEPLPGQLHVYRSPKLLSEQLFAFSAQLTLFADKRRTREDRKKTSQLCANSLPIVFFAAAGGPCRLLALTLMVVCPSSVRSSPRRCPVDRRTSSSALSRYRRLLSRLVVLRLRDRSAPKPHVELGQ
jgi:hypothetical protein